MKDKLIKKLKQLITDMKDKSESLDLEIKDDNRETIISELIIPFMQLTESENVAELADKLEMLINGSEENVETYDGLLNNIIDVIVEDSEAEEVDSEIEHLVTNAYAVLNKLNQLKEDSTDDTNTFDEFGAEIVSFMNNLDESTDDEDADADAGAEDQLEDETNDEAGDEVTDEDEEVVDEETDTATDAGVVAIVAPADEIDEQAWGDVNQIELKNTLETMLKDGVDGAEEAIRETFGLVRSMDKKSDWQWPHHVVKDGKVVLNSNGLKTASMFLLKPTSSKNVTPEEKTAIAEHLLRHYKETELEAPAKLAKLSDGKESIIVLNIKEDEMKEFGELFKVDVEDVATYVGLMESLLTDLVNSGIINIESDNADFDESVVSVKLDKAQTEELIKYFDIMSDDITHILNSEFGELAYKKTDSDLERSYQEASNTSTALETANEELEATIKERNEEISNLQLSIEDSNLDKAKFEAIINFVKTIDGVDETLIQFVNNVVEAENQSEVGYLLKLGATFIKAGNTKHTFKKVSMINHATHRDLDTLGDLVDGSQSESNTSISSEVDAKVNQIADMFD